MGRKLQEVAEAIELPALDGAALTADQNLMATMLTSHSEERDLVNQLLGQAQMAGAFEDFSRTVRTSKLAFVKENKLYRALKGRRTPNGSEFLSGTWEEFCGLLGRSADKVDLDIANLRTFGEEALESMSSMGIGYREMRQYRRLPEDQQVALIEAAKAGDKDAFLDLAEEVIAKHAKEKQELTQRLDETNADYEAQSEVMAKKTAELWRYVITDHTSGTLYLEYVLGAESAENLCNVLINAMQKRHESDPFHGVPWMLMTDPGAAMTSGIFRNLCRAMSIDLIINQVGNARAKGQVEQAHNIVEREFESALKFQAAESLEQINAWAGKWMRYFNATSIHTRTRRTRYGVWQLIKQEQLRLAPSIEVCRELAVSTPEYRKVSNLLRVSFRGAQFDVSSVPGVMVGERLLITRNCWRDKDAAIAVLVGEDGRENYHVIERIELDEFGFAETSATIGEQYKSHAETPAQVSRKVLEQLATGTSNQADAEAARKAKAVPFGGLIDPHKHINDTVLPSYMPRRGTSLNVNAPTVEHALLTHVEAAKWLQPRLANLWSAESFSWLQQKYPEGIPQEQLDAIEAELKRPVEVMRKPFSLVLAAVGGE